MKDKFKLEGYYCEKTNRWLVYLEGCGKISSCYITPNLIDYLEGEEKVAKLFVSFLKESLNNFKQRGND